MSHKNSAPFGVKWTSFSTAITTGLQFLQLAILANILSPEDFGLMAMILVVIGFAQAYADMGISNAIIHRQDITKEQLSSLYWLNIFAGIIVYLLLLILIPIVVKIFDEPRLSDLMYWAIIVIITTAFGQQFQILLQKYLQFKTLSIVEIIAAFFGTMIAIITALRGQGVFSLIWGQIGNSIIKSIMFAYIGWKKWRPCLRFKYSDLDGYLRFGFYQMGEKSINFIISHLDQFLIGVFIGAQALGFYNLAYNLVIQPILKINQILTRVAFPFFSKIQFNIERLKNGYLLTIKLLCFINIPLLIGLAVVAPYFVPVVFGDKWLPVVLLVQILAFVAILRSIGNPIGSLLLAKGRADLGFKWNVMVLITLIIGIYLGLYFGDVIGVTISLLILNIIYSFLNYLILIRKMVGPCLKEYLLAIFPTLGISILMAIIVAIIPVIINQSDGIILFSQILIGVIIYFSLNFTLRKQHIREIKQLDL